ncbi:MAG: hypothetical protein Q9M94_01200 [Candidatus Gracilibacteria bacterium]|nr:hypothetical protein [Candidatus Gracilibacteria bacterium]MDQ7022594.1 hypothetical protein [Candidatus Gracilibacteria bacterium]
MNKLISAILALGATFNIASADVRSTVDTTGIDVNKTMDDNCTIAQKMIITIDNNEKSMSDKEEFEDLISEIGMTDFKAMIEYSVSGYKELSAQGFLDYVKKEGIEINDKTIKMLEEEVKNENNEKQIKFELMKEYHDNLLHSK